MKCLGCQHENRPAAKFCEECATPLARTCANCEGPLSAIAKFCPGCAHPAATPATAPARLESPETYTPKHLAERILNSKSTLEGERKQVTVLFADLKGSMELLVDRDPEEARQILDPVLEHMMEAVHRYEGTVNQVMGDGIMALFGAPLAHEDHAARACNAALRMQESVSRYGDELRRAGGPPVQIRVGINSGEVVVRSIANDLHMDYTAVGQSTHLAARMEQLARPGSSVLTAATLELARGCIDVTPLGPLRVKGLADPVNAYELIGAGPVRRRFEAATLRGLTRFVGRETELEQLRESLEVAARGQGQVVAVVGEPGVGKSRLFHEFIRSHQAAGWLTLESGAVSYGRAAPYLAVIDLLKTFFGIESRDDGATTRRKVASRLLTLDRSLEATLPPVLWLLDVPVEDPEWTRLEPPQRRQRTLEAIRGLLVRQSAVQPLCVVFEDLHWIDSETEEFLDGLVRDLPGSRLLLLVNYRPEYQPRWDEKSHYRQLRIDPLPPESAAEFLEALLGTDGNLDALKHFLTERTAGNPFFIEESVRTLVETGVLIGGRGAYRLIGPLDDVQVPSTVQAVLAARIDRLAPEDKHLLQAASVIGGSVPFGLLKAVVDLPEEELRRRLSRLQASSFLDETRLFPDLEYTFKHGLTYRVAYNSLVRQARAAFHARIMDAIERLNADRLGEQIDRLAHHALLGEQWAKAVGYLRQAGEKAFARSAYGAAVAWYEQALGALSHLPEARQRQEQAIDVRFELRGSLLALGEHERTLAYLCEAEELAESLGDRRRTAWSAAYKTTYFWNGGDPERAAIEGQRALAIAQELGDIGLIVVANIGLGWAYHASGDYAPAIVVLERVLAHLEGDRAWEHFGLAGLPAVVARTWLAWCHAVRGEFSQGLRRAQEGLQMAAAVNRPYSLTIADFGLGLVHLRRGAIAEAIPVLERGLDITRTFGIRTWLTALASALGYAYARAGQTKKALPLLREAVEVSAAIGSRWRQSQRVAWLSEALLLDGQPEAAAALAHQALGLARSRREPGHKAEVLRLLGELAARRAPPDVARASTYYQEALALAGDLGMRSLVAQCHHGLGQLYREAGKSAEAEAHLSTAITLGAEMSLQE